MFKSIHEGDPDPKLLAYQYLQTLPQLAQGQGNTVWMIPSDLTSALRMVSSAFAGQGGAAVPESVPVPVRPANSQQAPTPVELPPLSPVELPQGTGWQSGVDGQADGEQQAER